MINKKTEEKKHWILRSEYYDKISCDYVSTEFWKKVSKVLNEKNKTTKSSNITYRIINHWEKIGLITRERQTEKGWRKYSIIDIVWIQIIITLRKFGFSLDKILLVKKALESSIKKEDINRFPILELYVAQAILYKIPIYLLIFTNGEAEPVTHSELLTTLDLLNLGDHIRISINQILQNIFPDKDMLPNKKTSLELLDEEVELLYMIRMQDYESIKLKSNDGKIERIEASEILKNDKRIIDILKDKKYQDIEIKQADGKIKHIKRTFKIKHS